MISYHFVPELIGRLLSFRALRDADDVRLLLAKLGLREVCTITDIVARYFPDEPLSERSRLLLEDILSNDNT